MSKNIEKKINSRKLMSISFTTFQSQEQNTSALDFARIIGDQVRHFRRQTRFPNLIVLPELDSDYSDLKGR